MNPIQWLTNLFKKPLSSGPGPINMRELSVRAHVLTEQRQAQRKAEMDELHQRLTKRGYEHVRKQIDLDPASSVILDEWEMTDELERLLRKDGFVLTPKEKTRRYGTTSTVIEVSVPKLTRVKD